LENILPASVREFDRSASNLYKSIRRGIGAAVLSPSAIEERANSQARAKLIQSSSESMARVIEALSEAETSTVQTTTGDASLAIRTIGRITQEALEQQLNRESVAELTRAQLESLEPQSDADSEIETDWLNIFWDLAEKRSDKDIQSIFARILAGEILEPGKFSARTLLVLATMSPVSAQLFEKVCNCSVKIADDDCFIVNEQNSVFSALSGQTFDKFDISFSDFASLRSLGLLSDSGRYSVTKDTENEEFSWGFSGITRKFSMDRQKTDFGIIMFSSVGCELRSLIAIEPPDGFKEATESYFVRKGFRFMDSPED
jgi:hypothetical protein